MPRSNAHAIARIKGSAWKVCVCATKVSTGPTARNRLHAQTARRTNAPVNQNALDMVHAEKVAAFVRQDTQEPTVVRVVAQKIAAAMANAMMSMVHAPATMVSPGLDARYMMMLNARTTVRMRIMDLATKSATVNQSVSANKDGVDPIVALMCDAQRA